MRLLVTGATGFVGRHWVRRALARGHKIRCFVRDAPRGEKIFAKSVEFAEGDLTQADSLIPAARGMEGVVHLAGVSFERESVTFSKIHVEGTRNLILAMKEAGIKRMLHMSILGAEKASRSRCLRSRWQGDEFVRKSGLDYTIFKPSLIFGPDDHLIANYMRLVRRLPFVPMLGTGKTRLQPVFVEDVVRAMMAALESPDARSKEYALGGPKALNSREILEILLSTYGWTKRGVAIPRFWFWISAYLMEKLIPRPLWTREQLARLKGNVTCDTSEAERDLGFKPMSLKRGIRDSLYL